MKVSVVPTHSVPTTTVRDNVTSVGHGGTALGTNMAYDPRRTRGASEGRALRNIEQLLDEHRQSIMEVRTIVDN